jgi:ATP-dependent RNA helicase DDX24/MAK5
MSSREYELLNDLTRLRFLIIDETDRMVKAGSFPQLSRILETIHRENPMDSDDEAIAEDSIESDDIQQGRMLSLPGIKGEAHVSMLTEDILDQLEEQRSTAKMLPKESFDDESELLETDAGEIDDISLPLQPPVNRLTFVFSATLTLPTTDKQANTKKRVTKTIVDGVQGAIEEILNRAHAKGKTKVVDMASGNRIDKQPKREGESNLERSNQASKQEKKSFQFPPGLKLQTIKCTQKHKDSFLYAYLMTTEEGSAGPCLVFCNSIAAVRRVGKMLETLGLDVRILHAQMQQVRDAKCLLREQ